MERVTRIYNCYLNSVSLYPLLFDLDNLAIFKMFTFAKRENNSLTTITTLLLQSLLTSLFSIQNKRNLTRVIPGSSSLFALIQPLYVNLLNTMSFKAAAIFFVVIPATVTKS